MSVEIGELRQALQAYHRILDLQNKFLDVEVSISLSRSLLYLYDALNFDLLSFGATYDSMCSYAEQILRCMVRAVLDGQEDRSGQSGIYIHTQILWSFSFSSIYNLPRCTV